MKQVDLLLSGDFLSGIPSVSNSLDPDQAQQNVRSDLGPIELKENLHSTGQCVGTEVLSLLSPGHPRNLGRGFN